MTKRKIKAPNPISFEDKRKVKILQDLLHYIDFLHRSADLREEDHQIAAILRSKLTKLLVSNDMGVDLLYKIKVAESYLSFWQLFGNMDEKEKRAELAFRETYVRSVNSFYVNEKTA